MSQSQGNNPFDDNIKKRLEEASFQPPEGLWDRIEKELPEKIPFYIRFKLPLVAAILTFTFMSSLLIYNRFESSILNIEEDFAQQISSPKDNLSNILNPNILYILNDLNLQSIQEGDIPSEINERKEVQKSGTSSSQVTTTQGFKGASYSANSSSDHSIESNVENELFASKKKSKSDKKRKSILNDHLSSISEAIVNKNSTLNLINSSLESTENLVVEDSVVEKNQESFEKLDLLASELFLDDENPSLDDPSQKGKKKSFKNKYVKKGLVVGPLVGAHYTAMTKHSNEGVNTSKLEQTTTFGNTYGLSIGYIINNHWSVGMEWIYNSEEGQKFNEIIKSQNVKKQIVLDYMKIPLYLKYSHKFVSTFEKCPITLNFVGGVHYSKLKSVNTFVDGQIAPVKVNYNEQEWGMLGGIEFDFYPTNRIYFTVGSRFTFNADLKQFPKLRGSDGTDPFSIQAGVYAKINYVFSFKKKD